jgi:plastocyanin
MPVGRIARGHALVFPKILIGVALVVGGMYLPPFSAPVHSSPADGVGMKHEAFSSDVITIHQGQKITFANSSRWIHIIGPGNDAHLTVPSNEPVTPRVLLERNQVYTTGVWNTPGTYYLTCTVHPEMNLKVIVEKK